MTGLDLAILIDDVLRNAASQSGQPVGSCLFGILSLSRELGCTASTVCELMRKGIITQAALSDASRKPVQDPGKPAKASEAPCACTPSREGTSGDEEVWELL